MATLETEHLGHFKLCILFIISVSICAQPYPDKDVNRLVKEGAHLLLLQNYLSSDSVFQILETEYKNIPFGKTFRAANSIAKSLDYGTEFDNEFITGNLIEAIDLAESNLEVKENDLWNNYFLAM